MSYGPFSLADATDAEMLWRHWISAESGYDSFCYYVSTDAYYWYGECINGGSSGGWLDWDYDLTNVNSLGDLTGESEVWIAFMFTSGLTA